MQETLVFFYNIYYGLHVHNERSICFKTSISNVLLQPVTSNLISSMLTDNAARLHSVLVNLHQVVGQIAQLWLHALWKHDYNQQHYKISVTILTFLFSTIFFTLTPH